MIAEYFLFISLCCLIAFMFFVLSDIFRLHFKTKSKLNEAMEMFENAQVHLNACKDHHERCIALEKELDENVEDSRITRSKLQDEYNQSLNW